MKLVTFVASGVERIGAIHADGFVVDFSAADTALPRTMQALIEAGDDALAAGRSWLDKAPAHARVAMDDVRLRAPLPAPRRLRDAFLFLEHLAIGLEKLGRTLNPMTYDTVMYYNCDHTHIYGPGDDVPWPDDSHYIDYELEWACVVGKPGLGISREQAREHIFGYTIFNDWSARDLQKIYMAGGSAAGPGKDFANGIGPCIVTPDEIGDPYALRMTGRVNGEVWGSGTTASMHHTFEAALAHFSRGAALVPGEIIGSGTVLNGCGLEFDRSLAIGDVVELEVENIGTLTNRVIRR